jgi:hypothetical protein
MTKNQELFKTEFTRRFRTTSLSISPTQNGKDFVISSNKVSKALLVRTEYPDVDTDDLMHLKEPAPFYHAESVLFFRFTMSDAVYQPDFMVFTYENQVLKRTDFLIFKTTALEACLGNIPIKPDMSGYYKLLLWIFPGDFVFVANNLSGEGEWYLLGGLEDNIGPSDCMANGSERDLSGYLNQWNAFNEFEAI